MKHRVYQGLLLGAAGLFLFGQYRLLGLGALFLVAIFLVWPIRARFEGRMILGALVLSASLWILHELRWIVYPLVLGALLAVTCEPMVGTLTRRKLSRAVAAGLAIAPLALLLVVTLLVLVPTVAREVALLVDRVPDAVESLRRTLDPLLERFAPNLADPNAETPGWVKTAPQTILGYLEKILRPAMAGAADLGRGLGRFAQVLSALCLAPLIAYYLLVDWPGLTAGVKGAIPPRYRARAADLGGLTSRVFRSYLRGQAIVAAIEIVLYAIGFSLSGLPEAISLGILAGIFSLLPVVGFWITVLTAVLSALISGDPAAALGKVAIVLFVVQVLEGQILVPRIQGQGLGLHPLVVLLGVLGFGVLFGVVGALLAVPILGVLAALTGEFRTWYLGTRFFQGPSIEPNPPTT